MKQADESKPEAGGAVVVVLPTYHCRKCGKGSWSAAGRPICCWCGAKAKLDRSPGEQWVGKDGKKP